MTDDAYCLDQMRRFDRDRYLCALFLPEPARRQVLTIGAFNLELARVRETVNEAVLGRIRLQWWREAIEEAASGRPRQHPVVGALARLMAEHDVSSILRQLVDARERDLDDELPADLAALEAYGEATAAPLLLLSLRFAGRNDPAAREAARHLGIAWSLIGLMRAAPFHARQRRVMLPRDLLDHHGVDPARLIEAPSSQLGLPKVVATLAARARVHLDATGDQRGAEFLPMVLARRHLRRIEQAKFNVFRPEIARPAGLDAIALSLRALLRHH